VDTVDHRAGGAPADDEPVITGDGAPPLTRQDLHNDVFGLRRRVPRGGVAALAGHDARLVAAAIVALDGWASRVELVGELDPAVVSTEAVVLRETYLEGVEHGDPSGAGQRPGEEAGGISTTWRLFSSGTTGKPTPTDHSIGSLRRRTRPVDRTGPGKQEQRRWGLLFSPTRMAGIQVLLQAIHGGDSLVDACGAAGLEERLERFAHLGVDALSATPTMWRMILRSDACDALSLRQITLGGEIANQALLNALSQRFAARITHVYASTEAGAAFSVSDAKEGFPRHFLEEAPAGVRLEIRDGVLFVDAPGSSVASPDGFVCTGDLVEIRGDRVLFAGRASGLVNVGGDKVLPERVEEVLRRHHAIHDAVVIPRRSAVTGWILSAEILPSSRGREMKPEELQSSVRAFAAEHLPRSHVPARITAVSQLSLSSTGKVSRT
jgi:acyl-coenzyme A synthetase/AMP-(fatty) acid ligase